MCGKPELLVKSHVLPQSLYPHKVAGIADTKVYSRDPNAYPRRSRTGVWDDTIVCRTCEGLFQQCDDHAQKVLRARPKEPGPDYFILSNYDYSLLKRFFIALLWRASASSQELFSQVDVGPTHDTRLRQLILTNDPGEPEEYAVWLTTFDDPSTAGIVLQPTRYKLFGVNVYRFVAAGFSAFIKVDQQRTPYPYSLCILRPNGESVVLVRSWQSSLERRDVLRVAATARGP
jgi:hypothetical protein